MRRIRLSEALGLFRKGVNVGSLGETSDERLKGVAGARGTIFLFKPTDFGVEKGRSGRRVPTNDGDDVAGADDVTGADDEEGLGGSGHMHTSIDDDGTDCRAGPVANVDGPTTRGEMRPAPTVVPAIYVLSKIILRQNECKEV